MKYRLSATGGSFSMKTRLFQRRCLTNTPDPWNGAPIQIVCCIFIFASIWSSGICPGPSTITCTSFAHARLSVRRGGQALLSDTHHWHQQDIRGGRHLRVKSSRRILGRYPENHTVVYRNGSYHRRALACQFLSERLGVSV